MTEQRAEPITMAAQISGLEIIDDLAARLVEGLSHECHLREADAYESYAAVLTVEIQLRGLDTEHVEKKIVVGDHDSAMPSHRVHAITNGELLNLHSGHPLVVVGRVVVPPLRGERWSSLRPFVRVCKLNHISGHAARSGSLPTALLRLLRGLVTGGRWDCSGGSLRTPGLVATRLAIHCVISVSIHATARPPRFTAAGNLPAAILT
jgi:hypothetical protein